jgi:hypothetical protein
MTINALINRAYRAYRGKTADKTPVWGDAKSLVALDIANQKQSEWAKDSNQTWNSLFGIQTLTPTISTSLFTYNLPTNFVTPSDSMIVTLTTGTVLEVPLTNPQSRDQGSMYIYGNNPKIVAFGGTTIDPTYQGGTINAPGYYMPADMSQSTDVVSVDDPNWLVYAVAAELSRNDPAKEDQFANLLGMANDLYGKMIDANIALGSPQQMTVPTNIPQISPGMDDVWDAQS